MKRLSAALGVVLLLTACGSSADPVATQVASTKTAIAESWTATPSNTPTPTSTPTPTLVPYSAAIHVVDENNLPLEGVTITLRNADNPENPQLTDSQGTARWDNLADSNVDIRCTLQGYQIAELAQSIKPGDNRIEVTLERDPFGLLPGEILADGETLLFLEDFQDNTEEFVELVGNWNVIEDPAEPGNFVLEVSPQSTDRDYAYVSFGDEDLVDFILEYRVMYMDLDYDSDNWIWFKFRSTYSMSFSPYWKVIDIIDFSMDDWVFLHQTPINFRSNSWYDMRIEAIGSEVSFFINNSLISRVRNVRTPEETERLSISAGQDVTAYFDNIVLSAPAE